MGNIVADKTELTLKLIATFFAAAVFLALFWGAFYLTPRSDTSSGAFYGAENNRVGRANAEYLPVPPHSEKIKSESLEETEIYLYESRLSAEEARSFYSSELPRLGWREFDMQFAGTPKERELLRGAMYFTDGAASCIINVEEKDNFRIYITVMKSVKSQIIKEGGRKR